MTIKNRTYECTLHSTYTKVRKCANTLNYLITEEKCSFFDQRQAPKMCVIFGLFFSGNTF